MTEKNPLSILDVEDIYWKLSDYEIIIDAIHKCVDVHYSGLDSVGRRALHEVTVLLGVFENHHQQQLEQLQKLIEESSNLRFSDKDDAL